MLERAIIEMVIVLSKLVDISELLRVITISVVLNVFWFRELGDR